MPESQRSVPRPYMAVISGFESDLTSKATVSLVHVIVFSFFGQGSSTVKSLLEKLTDSPERPTSTEDSE